MPYLFQKRVQLTFMVLQTFTLKVMVQGGPVGMLAQGKGPLHAGQLRRVGLVSGGLYGHRRPVETRFMGEGVGADHWLVRLQSDPGHGTGHPGQSPQFGGVQASVQSQELLAGQGELLQGHIASPLPQTGYSGGHPCGSGPDRCQGIGGGQSKVVVTVDRDRQFGIPLSDQPHQIGHSLGGGGAHGIGKTQSLNPGFGGRTK